MIKNKNIQVRIDYSGKEPELYTHMGFSEIKDIFLSIAHRNLSNRGSGLFWHPKTNSWARELNGVTFANAYESNHRDTRIYHDSIEEHIFALELLKRKNYFLLMSNGNLGNNPLFVAHQYDKLPRLYCLAKEFFLKNIYSCFIVPKDLGKDNPQIGKVKFNSNEDILDENGQNISNNVNWCTYGQQIVENYKDTPLEDIIEQFADPRHIFNLKDFGERKEKDGAIISELLEGYPNKYREKMLAKLRGSFPRAEYLHSVLGVDETGIGIMHYRGTIEEVSKKVVDKGVKDAIILDQGGSVGVYGSWIYPNGGWLNTSSYFRPSRISWIGFELKED